MRKSLSPAALGFAPGDLRRLSHALSQARETRVFRRLQAVLLVAQGQGFPQAAHAIGLDRRTVYRCVARYLARHQTADLQDRPRTGRPSQAPGLTRNRILQALRHSPLRLGYRTNVWTVPALTLHLNERHHSSLSCRTVRRRMKQIGLVCKRPRYFYSEKDPHRAQKKGGHCAEIEGSAAQGGAPL
jgi:transposase